MTNPEIDTAVPTPKEPKAMSNDEAAERLQNDQALRAGDMADEDARTPDTSPVGDSSED
jgi:hypothetical protein